MRKVIALLAALTSAGCMDEEATQPTASLNPMVAHHPAQYLFQADIVVQSLPAYTDLDGASAANNGRAATLEVAAAGTIPRFADAYIGSVAVFGYAWADLDSGKGFVAVIHPLIGRDSNQNPTGWHTHPVQLTGGTGDSDFCIVGIGTSQGGIAILGDQLRVNVAAQHAGFQVSDLDVAASFVVQGDNACGSGLGVMLLDTAAL